VRRVPLTLALVSIVGVACATNQPGVGTERALDSKLPRPQSLDISLDPNAVDAGGEVTLSVHFDGQPPGDYIGAAGMSWECWKGDSWVETHILVRAFNESAKPSAIDLSADGDVGVPDIGLNVPNSYDVLIPQVAPGIYRITDRIFGPDSTLTAHVAVEVRE